jgi:hypothetical protein
MKLSEQITLLFMLRHHAMSNTFIHSRNRKKFYSLLSKKEKRRRQKRIPRIALLFPHQSPWRKLYMSRSDQAFITLTGLDVNAFGVIFDMFAPVFDSISPHDVTDAGTYRTLNNPGTKGRKRLIDARDALGLVLAWTRTRGSQMVLQMIFGMSQTCVSKYIQFGSRLLVQVLQRLEEAKVKIPSINYVEQMKVLVRRRHPLLESVWCTMDGLKLIFCVRFAQIHKFWSTRGHVDQNLCKFTHFFPRIYTNSSFPAKFVYLCLCICVFGCAPILPGLRSSLFTSLYQLDDVGIRRNLKVCYEFYLSKCQMSFGDIKSVPYVCAVELRCIFLRCHYKSKICSTKI